MIKLKVENLGKKFGRKTVFSNLSMDVDTSVLGIAGVNGSGKSTLLKCLAGLLKPTSGNIEWFRNGQKIEKEKLKNFVGYAAPYIQLYEELTVRENIVFIHDIRSLPKSKPIEELLKPFGAESLAEAYFGELSTGQQQRIKLASAVLHDPDILMLDEPGANLDEDGKDVVHQLVERFTGHHRMVFIASNQQDELSMCREIIELS